jgi:hypothetical protein
VIGPSFIPGESNVNASSVFHADSRASVVAAASVQVAHMLDVVIFRGSDTLYGWVFDTLQARGLTLGAIALCALSVVARPLVLSAALGD